MTHLADVLLHSLYRFLSRLFFLLLSCIGGYRTQLLVQLPHHLQGGIDLIVLLHGRFLVGVKFATIFDYVPVRL